MKFNMKKALLIGPITRDIIIKGSYLLNSIKLKGNNIIYKSTGGAVYYQAEVFSSLGLSTTAIVTIAKTDYPLLKTFSDNVKLFPIHVEKTMKFENIYPTDDPNYRIQNAYVPKNPIKVENLHFKNLNQFDMILLGPLCPYDIPLGTIEHLSKFNIPLYLGAQGYLRHSEGNEIILKPWKNFQKILRFVKILFIDEKEAQTILGSNLQDLDEIAKTLTSFGPEEVIITQGNKGAIIYSKMHDRLYKIPIFTPKRIEDPTGLGDTYMAAYAAKKLEVEDPESCGIFAAAVSAIKLENKGAFRENRAAVEKKMNKI